MAIEDLRAIDAESPIEADLCIVGSGPAGWTIAEEFRHSGFRILILESGGLEPDPDSDALNQIENIGARLFNGRNRILGGTSHTWSGRCVALDDIDYEERPWVPLSGWPFGSKAVAPFLDRAYKHLGVCPEPPSQNGPDPAGLQSQPEVDPALLRIIRWHFSQDTANSKDFMRFGPRFLADKNPNLRILVHATVTHLNTDATGMHLESVEVADPEGKRFIIRARTVVLCAGGVENARILLYSNRIVPNGVGNAHDTVGRYLMDHPRDDDLILRFDTRDSARVRAFFGPYKRDSARGRQVFQNGLALGPERQRRERLLNCVAWLDESCAVDDPIEAAKRLVTGPRTVRDVGLLLSQPGIVLRALHERLLRGRSVTHKLDRIGFLVASEQCPNPDSRIRLSDRRDQLGVPISKIDWRISEQEKASQAALAQTIAREFQRLGLPTARLADWARDGRHEGGRFVDGCHPAGTTRMAHDPREGVVDANCQVHGVKNLYVAGSSIFPTNGHANPTLMIIALAVRLADHVREQFSKRLKFQPVSEPGHVLSAD